MTTPELQQRVREEMAALEYWLSDPELSPALLACIWNTIQVLREAMDK